MFVVTHGQRGSERFEWQSVHKVGEMWEQHKDAMEWPYWFMEGKIVRDPAGQLGQDRWWATTKASGTRVYFFKIGAGHVLGYATLHCVEGPLTSDRWAETRQMHCISGDKLQQSLWCCSCCSF
jgi:hypothetical protein